MSDDGIEIEENLLVGAHSKRPGPWNLTTVYDAFPLARPDSFVSLRSYQDLVAQGKALARDNVVIAGFIVTGSAPKRVLLRAMGPSLKSGDSPSAPSMLAR